MPASSVGTIEDEDVEAVKDIFPQLMVLPYPFQRDEPEWRLVEKNARDNCLLFAGVASLESIVFVYVTEEGPPLGLVMMAEASAIWFGMRSFYKAAGFGAKL